MPRSHSHIAAAALSGSPIRSQVSPKPPLINIEPSQHMFSLRLRELWAYRELLYFLAWRDIKIRYKQTAIGAAWAIFQPLFTMMIFTQVFSRIANVSSDGFPYPIFAYTALLPWTLFASALSRSSLSLVADSNLISKVYFPRLIVPVSATLSGTVDFLVAFTMLIVMMSWYGIAPSIAILSLPLFVVFVLITALAIGLWLAAMNVRYRDIGHAVPFFIQMWMFASPVAYSVHAVPAKWRFLYSLNPLAGVIEGFRWALLGLQRPDFGTIAVSGVVTLALLYGGIVYFTRVERTFADVV
jgi:lipopolysaccharide transport system permease protein